MWRLAIFFLVILGLGFGFAWLADRPGDLVLTFGGMRYELTLITAVAALLALIVAAMVIWWLLRAIFTSPRSVSRYFRARKRDRGYQALSTGLLAAGSGDAVAARLMAQRASGFISADQEPLIPYLEAQAALLEGKHDQARAIFTEMIEHGETKALGLHGLYLEARRLGEPVAAMAYAEEAVNLSPQLGWASEAALSARISEQSWDKALDLVEKRRQSKQIDKDQARRHRAVVLTGKAMAMVQADPGQAKSAALEAVRLAPDLVPASLAAADALVRLNDMRRAAKVLETAWKAEPHPQIAQAYTHLRAGDSALDRLTRAKRLEKSRPNNPQALLALAGAEMEAGNYSAAKTAIEAVLRQAPTENAWLLLADIEERQTGDQGRVRHWLRHAVQAPRDPAWTADGMVAEHWAPISPVTGRIDAFEWKVPVAQTGTLIEVAAQPIDDDLVQLMHAGPDAADSAPTAAPGKPAVATVEIEAEPSSEPEETSDDSEDKAKDKAGDKPGTVIMPAAPDAADKGEGLADTNEGHADATDKPDNKQAVVEPEGDAEPDAETVLRHAGRTPGKEPKMVGKPKSGFRLF